MDVVGHMLIYSSFYSDVGVLVCFIISGHL
jgi:hypothetical protein